MYSLNINSRVLYFRDLKISDLPHLLKWYNNVADFKFATGIDEPISFKEMTNKFFKSHASSMEFFVGIYKSSSMEMIGMLKGQLQHKSEDAGWISSIIIDPAFQGKGYGREAVNLLIKHLRENSTITSLYLSVAEQNIKGKIFWEKQSFREVKRINTGLGSKYKPQNIIIMYRKI